MGKMMREGGLLAAASVILLAGCATMPAKDPASTAPGAHYVSMGSSFAAGAGMQPVKADMPERCGRSQVNYASLLAEALSLTLSDVACDGATSAHVLGPWDELAPQLDAITPETQLVTITIGGNNLRYVGNLFAASCRAGVKFRTQSGEERGDCPPLDLAGEADYRQLQDSLLNIAAAVKDRAPEARLVFVQYVTLIAEESCAAAPLLPEDAAALRETGARLAAVTAQAARIAGADIISAEELSRGHTPCDAQPWSRAFSNEFDFSKGAPWHPNAAGHAAIADALRAMLER